MHVVVAGASGLIGSALVDALRARGDEVTVVDDLSTGKRENLREGVTFHDGSAFDSKDVAATYRAVLDPKSASPIADDYRLIDEVETPDASTVVFRLKAPNGGFASRLLLGIAPSALHRGATAVPSRSSMGASAPPRARASATVSGISGRAPRMR